MAGINAHLKVNEKAPFILKRSEAYIGVLIDDLVNKGTKEPYRMFTSRAEYRILLRQDNADVRLTPLAHRLAADSPQISVEGVPGLEDRMEKVSAKLEASKAITSFFENHSVTPDAVNGFLESIGSAPIKQQVKLHGILLRPNVSMEKLRTVLPEVETFCASHEPAHLNDAEIEMKYAGYIRKEQEMVDKMNRLEAVKIIDGFDFHQLSAISKEAREKLTRIKPRTIGQASRISGVTPADVSVLLVHMGR